MKNTNLKPMKLQKYLEKGSKNYPNLNNDEWVLLFGDLVKCAEYYASHSTISKTNLLVW